MFDNRHFDTKRETWYIGDDEKGRDQINETVDKFYDQILKLMNLSEEIRELNEQMKKINSISFLNAPAKILEQIM